MSMTMLRSAVAIILFASGIEQSGYLTGAPVTGWLGLATSGGRDAVVLGQGCDAATPGMNVAIVAVDLVKMMDPVAGPLPGICSLTKRVHMSDVPCARSFAGLCDVAFD